MTTNYIFGNAVRLDRKLRTWFLISNDKPVTLETRKILICPKCNRCPTEEGHDPCIANLPGVMFACCGHGIERGYVYFENYTIIRGEFSIESMESKNTQELDKSF